MNLRPLGNRIVVEPIEQEDITAGGIVLPETAKEKPQKGTVLFAGAGERNDKGERIAMDVKIGDTVKITMLDGTEYIYVVDRTIVIDPMDLEYYVDGDDGTGRQITLVSCTYTGEGTMRILVIGHILEGED